ncbi:MAG: 4-aminobutyrate--2-oxoglutarate transaminase [Deltaproteobacteria bacterium]|nr:4-aminobutyrate--2-oxoglutarate transaminase [Deltaproteobacteria bacterium]
MSTEENLSSLKRLREQYLAKGIISASERYISSAKGSLLTDSQGKEYIDFAGGIAVMNIGHSHPKVVEALKKQAEKFTHTCFMVNPYQSAIKLAEKLCAATPGNFAKSAFFANSGAEAVENAIKIARYYTKKKGIIAFENAFHGRTLLAMTLTGKVKPYKYGFGPFAPEIYKIPYAYCYRCPFNLKYPECDIYCAENLKDFFIKGIDPENTAAVIVEPIQGEGGFITPPKEYFQKIKKICEENNILFIADEIQTGIGRTGKMFAMQHYNVIPDITLTAKSLAAGMPLSAIVGKKEIINSVHPAGIGGTYNANPLSCEAALAVFDIIETENILQQAKALGENLKSHLENLKAEYQIIGDVRGIGAMIAMELVKDRKKKTPAQEEAKALTKYCLDKGLILLSCGVYGNVIRFLMPLTIPERLLSKGLEIIKEGLSELRAND